MRIPSALQAFLRLIKWEHSLFSIPLFLAGAALPRGGFPRARTLGLIFAAGLSARAVALVLNRVMDAAIDARNPRTRNREIPAGALSRSAALGMASVPMTIYLAACAMLGRLPLYLSPVPIAVFALYPSLKRYTQAAHFGVGFALALAPLGAAVAVLDAVPVDLDIYLLSLFTLFWVSGFDILYSIADIDFDRSHGLHSIPSRYGVGPARMTAAILHAVAAAVIILLLARLVDPISATTAVIVILALFCFQHAVWRRAERIFFQVNALIGVVTGIWVTVGCIS